MIMIIILILIIIIIKESKHHGFHWISLVIRPSRSSLLAGVLCSLWHFEPKVSNIRIYKYISSAVCSIGDKKSRFTLENLAVNLVLLNQFYQPSMSWEFYPYYHSVKCHVLLLMRHSLKLFCFCPFLLLWTCLGLIFFNPNFQRNTELLWGVSAKMKLHEPRTDIINISFYQLGQ